MATLIIPLIGISIGFVVGHTIGQLPLVIVAVAVSAAFFAIWAKKIDPWIKSNEAGSYYLKLMVYSGYIGLIPGFLCRNIVSSSTVFDLFDIIVGMMSN